MTAKFSKRVEFNDRQFRFAHGHAPRFGAGVAGWAFVVPAWRKDEVIWTKGRTRAECAAEIAAVVQAPVGWTIEAVVQS